MAFGLRVSLLMAFRCQWLCAVSTTATAAMRLGLSFLCNCTHKHAVQLFTSTQKVTQWVRVGTLYNMRQTRVHRQVPFNTRIRRGMFGAQRWVTILLSHLLRAGSETLREQYPLVFASSQTGTRIEGEVIRNQRSR